MQVGSYQILFELARGGMGTVFLARAVGAGGFERLVAIKRAHEHVPANARASERFLEEARVAAYVHHANVVSTHVAGSDDAGHYLVSDYVEGASLGELIACAVFDEQRLPPAVVLRVGIDALAGLHAVHETTDPAGVPLGILHRDVSAQNLLVGRDGVTRLTDFGIAKSSMSSVETDQQYIVGKLPYLAPEYLARLPVGRTLDIYAMGVTLWTALSGKGPWRGADDAQRIEEILMRGVPPLPEAGVDVSPLIAAVVARACHRDPRERYQTARQMLDALEAAGRKSGLLASHVEVAEYVDSMVGSNLAERREAIKSCCAELAPAAATDVEPIAPTSDREHAQQDEPPTPDSNDLEIPDPREWQRPWPRRLVLLSVLATTLAILYALAGRHAASTTAPIALPAAPRFSVRPPAAQVAHGAAGLEPNGDVPAIADRPAVEESKTQPPAARAVKSKRPSRVGLARRAAPTAEPSFDRISTNNPYR